MPRDFFESYLEYTRGGEVPICFHRWAAIVGIGALLERNAYLPFGHTQFYPNQYAMLIGNAGTKKSTAIKLMKRLLIKVGFNNIAAERTSKEKYLADLAAQNDSSGEDDSLLEKNIFGSVSDTEVTPNLIAADEANDFFGINNIDFLSILGSLWDWEGKYENRIKTGKSDFIANPTINILAGNTPTGFATAFPSSILGQGFFSRLLLIYSEPTGTRITIPRTPAQEETEAILNLMAMIKQVAIGRYEYGPNAHELIDKIYQQIQPAADIRFESYQNRRLTHLLKLCLVIAACRFEKVISETTVLQANTYLRYIERLMPKALGEFGKAKNSDISHRVLSVIETKFPISMRDLFKEVSSELEKPEQLGEIIRKLTMAEKIQVAGHMFMPIRKIADFEDEEREGMVAYEEFLTLQELGVKA